MRKKIQLLPILIGLLTLYACNSDFVPPAHPAQEVTKSAYLDGVPIVTFVLILEDTADAQGAFVGSTLSLELVNHTGVSDTNFAYELTYFDGQGVTTENMLFRHTGSTPLTASSLRNEENQHVLSYYWPHGLAVEPLEAVITGITNGHSAAGSYSGSFAAFTEVDTLYEIDSTLFIVDSTYIDTSSGSPVSVTVRDTAVTYDSTLVVQGEQQVELEPANGYVTVDGQFLFRIEDESPIKFISGIVDEAEDFVQGESHNSAFEKLASLELQEGDTLYRSDDSLVIRLSFPEPQTDEDISHIQLKLKSSK